jgi:hypothetical protein
VTGLRDALTRLTPDERLHVLHALAERHPADVEREAAYVHERRVWYPNPPIEAAR